MDNSSAIFIVKRLQDQTETFLTFYSALLRLLAIGSVIANLSAIMKILTTTTLRTVSNILSVMVNFNLLVQSSVDLPLKIYLNSLMDEDVVPNIVCRSLILLEPSTDLSCAFLMTVMAVNKWAAVTKDPLLYLKLFSSKQAGVLALLAMTLSYGFVFIFQLLIDVQQHFSEFMLTCQLRADLDDAETKAYLLVIFMLYAGTMMVSVLCYTSIVCHYRKVRRKIQIKRTRTTWKKTTLVCCREISLKA